MDESSGKLQKYVVVVSGKKWEQNDVFRLDRQFSDEFTRKIFDIIG